MSHALPAHESQCVVKDAWKLDSLGHRPIEKHDVGIYFFFRPTWTTDPSMVARRCIWPH